MNQGLIIYIQRGVVDLMSLRLAVKSEWNPHWRNLFDFQLLKPESFHDANFAVTGNTGGYHHDDVIKCKHFTRYWPIVWGIHWSPVNSPHKGQWRGALVFSLICARINDWASNREAGDLRRYRALYDVTVRMMTKSDAVSDDRVMETELSGGELCRHKWYRGLSS